MRHPAIAAAVGAALLVLGAPLHADDEWALDSVILPPPRPKAVSDIQPRYTVAEFAIALVGKDVRVDIHGNPFPEEPQEQLNAAVLRAMQVREWDYPRAIRPDTTLGRKIVFTTAPKLYRPDYRIAVFFGAPEGTDAQGLCRTGESLPRYGTGLKRIATAFCRNSEPIAASHMDFAGAASSDDPKFRWAVTACMRAMFPEQMFFQFQRSARPRFFGR